MHESSGGLSSSPRSIALSINRKGSANGIADFSGPLALALYRVRPQWHDKLQLRGIDKPQPRWR